MGAKIYTGEGIRVDNTAATDIDTISDWMQQYESNKRANKQLMMQEAKHKFTMENMRQTKVSAEALMTHTGGHDWEALSDFDNTDIFSQNLPDAGAQYRKYKTAMQANGVSAIDDIGFFQSKMDKDKQYMTQVIKRHNSVYDQISQNNPGLSPEEISGWMQENMHGNNVYKNAMQVFGPDEVVSMLKFTPQARKVGWGEWIGGGISSMLGFKPTVEGPGGTGQDTGGGWSPTKPMIGGAAFMGGRALHNRQVNSLAEDILEQAKKDWKTPEYKKNKKGKPILDKKKKKIRIGGGLEPDAFKAKYGVTKSTMGKRGGEFTGTTKSGNILKQAQGESWFGKGKAWAGGKMPDKMPTKKEALQFGKKALPYAVGGTIGAELAEAAGADGFMGEAVGQAGGAIGFNKIMKKVASPEGAKQVINILNKAGVGKKTIAKLGISAAGIAAPEAISTAVGGLGLAWTAYDLGRLAMEIPALYDYLSGE